MKPIPYARQDITEADIQAVVAVLKSDFLTQGPAIERFERAVAEYCGVKHAVAVSSCTAALHLAALALNLGPGKRLWTSPNTFVASANCARYCGAEVDFVDIEPGTWNLSADRLREKLIQAQLENRLPDVVVPVHFSGQSCDMEAIAALGREFGFKIIEDAAHAIGGRYQGKPVGCCQWSDITVLSFHPVKIITTAEGGMLVTNSDELYRLLLRLRTHGITRDASLMEGPVDGPWYYEQLELGYHYRLTDVQAALGTSQLARIDEMVARRQELARRYDTLLAKLPLTLPARRAEAYSAWHLYVVRLDLDRIKLTHREVFEKLRAAGILVNLHYIPVYWQPYYHRLGFVRGYCPEAERYYAGAISLPMFYSLTDAEQDRVAAALTLVLS